MSNYEEYAAKVAEKLAAFDAKIRFWEVMTWLSAWWMFGAIAAIVIAFIARNSKKYKDVEFSYEFAAFLVFLFTNLLLFVFMYIRGLAFDDKIAFVRNGYK